VIKGQRGQKVQGKPSSEVIDGNLLRIGDNLAFARHEGGAEVQQNICNKTAIKVSGETMFTMPATRQIQFPSPSPISFHYHPNTSPILSR